MIIRTQKTINYWKTDVKLLATTQRVASAAMAEALGPAGRYDVRRITLSEARSLRAQQDYPVVIWIREPFDRLACAYHIWNEQKTGMTPNDFSQKVMAEGNPHFSPQVKLHSPAGEFLPTVVYAYEQLAETWPLEFGKFTLQHIGKQSLRMSTEEFINSLDDEVKSALEVHYLDDQLMHQIAIGNPGCRIRGLSGEVRDVA